MARLTERLELILRTDATGAGSGEVCFRTRRAAEAYLKTALKAIGGDEDARASLPCTDWSIVTAAWIAGEDTGAVYFS